MLWKDNRKDKLAEFQAAKPGLNEYEMCIKKYHELHEEVSNMPSTFVIGTLALDLQPLKLALKREASAWKTDFGTALNAKGKGKLDKYLTYMDETMNKLGRKVFPSSRDDIRFKCLTFSSLSQVEDLSDINQLMSVLSILREKESVMEMKMIPIEESYQVLRSHVRCFDLLIVLFFSF